MEAVKLGAFDYIKKPVDLEEMRLLADRARETSQLRQELSYYRRKAANDVVLTGIVGSSPAMRAVHGARPADRRPRRDPAGADHRRNRDRQGTGGPHHSRRRAPRGGRPFIDVNCTALPATLMEAELFGYERGAFTDAKESKLGLFEAAEGGFLFLDEVGDIELALQGKLLRAIEDRTVRRVGGIRDRKIDVRILAATNRDLEREVAAGPIPEGPLLPARRHPARLPPLRERGDDILLLARSFPAALQRQVRQGRSPDRRAGA